MRFISSLREAQDTKGREKFKTMSSLADREPVAVEADLHRLDGKRPCPSTGSTDRKLAESLRADTERQRVLLGRRRKTGRWDWG